MATDPGAKVSFTKGSGKFDLMTVHRHGATQQLPCPKQRIIPHDMVHWAVETTLRRRGFLSRVRDGEAADFRMQADAESDGVERLVEVFQGDAWSGGGSSAEDMIDLYRVTCRARACPALAVTPGDMLEVRRVIAELDGEWQALPVGQSLVLAL